MLTVPPAVKLWYCPDAVDMRLGFDGLFALVRNRLKADPLSGHLLRWPSLSPSPHRWFLSRPLALLGLPPGRRDELGRGRLAAVRPLVSTQSPQPLHLRCIRPEDPLGLVARPLPGADIAGPPPSVEHTAGHTQR